MALFNLDKYLVSYLTELQAVISSSVKQGTDSDLADLSVRIR